VVLCDEFFGLVVDHMDGLLLGAQLVQNVQKTILLVHLHGSCFSLGRDLDGPPFVVM
jgi:hypothetical protein